MDAVTKFLQQKQEVIGLTSQQLRQKWLETFGVPPANAYSKSYMRTRLANFEKIKKQRETKPRAYKKYTPYPGITRSRRYKGEEHVVREVENGFEYKGELYQSYTAIAKRITGYNRNGLEFFKIEKEDQRTVDDNGLFLRGKKGQEKPNFRGTTIKSLQEFGTHEF